MFFRVRRVCRRRCCCQRRGCLRDATAGSGVIGLPPRLRPSASRPGPCRFPCRRCSGHPKTSICAPLVNFHSPSEFQAHSPCQSLITPFKRWGGARWLLSRGFAPLQRSRYKASTQRGVACRFVPTSSFLTTSSACSALNRPTISAGGTPGVCFALQGDSRPPEQPPRCRDGCSLMTLLQRFPPSAGTAAPKSCRRTSLPCLQGLTRWVDRCRSRPVSRLRGPDPLMAFSLWDQLSASDPASASPPSKLSGALSA